MPIDAAGQLGELVVAQDQVGAVGVLALECGDDVEELVRAVAAVIGIGEGPVNQLLKNEMPRRGGGRVRRKRVLS